MRRPLFTTGVKKVTAAGGPVDVFSPYTFGNDANLVYAVTLYAWAWQNTAPIAGASLPTISVGLATTGATLSPVIAAQRIGDDFAAQQVAELAAGVARPVKLLDQLMVRGDQDIQVANNGNFSCFVYGFFEVAGETPTSVPFRPLQPGALVPPYDAAPTNVKVVPAGPVNAFATAHQLSDAYIDDLTLHTTQGSNAADSTALFFVLLPGGVQMPLPVDGVHVLLESVPFESQPMIAPTSSDNLVQVGMTNAGAGNAIISAYGSFQRR